MAGKRSFREKRRHLLKLLGMGGLAAAGQSAMAQVRIDRVLNNARVADGGRDAVSITLLRPEDLLSIELKYYNFSLSGNQLVKKADPAYLAVIFQPQTMAEQAWHETSGGFETPTVPGRLLLSGNSRLVFRIPATVSTIPLQLLNLLAWEKYDLVVNDRAKAITAFLFSPSAQNKRLTDFQQRIKTAGTRMSVKKAWSKDEKKIITATRTESQNNRSVITRVSETLTQLTKDPVGPPAELETSLEIPLRLYLSPSQMTGWKHRITLKADKGMLKATNRLFELWHTRLANRDGNNLDDSDESYNEKFLRALWADDANKDYQADVIEQTSDPQLLLSSITNKSRHQIVHESSNLQIPGFNPRPIRAKKLFLSALGGWLDSEFTVEPAVLSKAGLLQGKVLPQAPTGRNALNLLKWRHIETLGREHYVEIVKAGYILPFGHAAALLTITERKFHAGTGTAANFQRELVVITEPSKDYNYRSDNGKFLHFSFNEIEFLTTVSPLLDPDASKKKLVTPSPMAARDQFWITAGGKEVPFKIRSKDLEGNIVNFSIPVVFVNSEILGNPQFYADLLDRYNNAGLNANSDADLKGQRFALAEKTTNGADTVYAAHTIRFRIAKTTDADEPQGFLPEISEVEIIEPSYQRLTGSAKPVSVSLVDDANKGHVFASFNYSQPVNFAGNCDKTGGFAAPNFNLAGLSKAIGAFAGKADQVMNAAMSAVDYFNVNNLPDPTLFGVFKLSEILNFASSLSDFDLSKPLLNLQNPALARATKIPNLVTEDKGDAFITSYVLKPGLQSYTNAIVGFVVNGNSSFKIETQIKSKKGTPTSPPPAPELYTYAGITDFYVGIIRFDSPAEYLIQINFNTISFKAGSNTKPDVSVVMKDSPISFGGPLKFLNEINKLIDPKGFFDPPYLDVTTTGIKCGYTLALPNLQLGAFTLSHLSLAADVNLPFTGAPLTMGFRFCERQQPFTLTVSLLGGGGFFGFEVDMHGLRQLEAALEFGAAASINLGVASGAVSIMAGIYFKIKKQDGENSTELTGYVRINGAVSVLGLITASIELYMALTYLIDKEKAFGEATLKIKVEVLFFSTSVSLHAQRSFGGNGSDPNIQQSVTKEDWLEYCAAFAA